jgi:hypothetical protein
MSKPMSKAEAGRLGGRATFARHGSSHMRMIGKRGFAAPATFARGGRRVALETLAERGKIRPYRPIDRDADYGFEALYESIAAGTGTGTTATTRADDPIPY